MWHRQGEDFAPAAEVAGVDVRDGLGRADPRIKRYHQMKMCFFICSGNFVAASNSGVRRILLRGEGQR